MNFYNFQIKKRNPQEITEVQHLIQQGYICTTLVRRIQKLYEIKQTVIYINKSFKSNLCGIKISLILTNTTWLLHAGV